MGSNLSRSNPPTGIPKSQLKKVKRSHPDLILWLNQIDQDEKKLQKREAKVIADEDNLAEYMDIYHRKEVQVTERAIADCVCHHEPSCPNSKIFGSLSAYHRTGNSRGTKFEALSLGELLKLYERRLQRLRIQADDSQIAPPEYAPRDLDPRTDNLDEVYDAAQRRSNHLEGWREELNNRKREITSCRGELSKWNDIITDEEIWVDRRDRKCTCKKRCHEQ